MDFICPVCKKKFSGEEEKVRSDWSDHMAEEKHLSNTRKWLAKQLEKNPKLVNGLRPKDILSNSITITSGFIRDISYEFLFKRVSRKNVEWFQNV